MKRLLPRSVAFTPLLVVSFGVLASIVVVSQAIVGLGSARENTEELLADKAALTVDAIEWRVHSVMRPVVRQALAMAAMA